MSNLFKKTGLYAVAAFALLLATGPARADNVATSGSTTASGTDGSSTSSEDPQIAQLRKIATSGQSAVITAQVNDFIDQNKDSISALLKSCEDYLSGLKSSLSQEGTGTTTDTSGAPLAPPPVAQTTTPASTSPSLQPGALQPSSLQPSVGLRTNHLAGYPSLPATDPTTSLQKLTPEQIQYAVRIQKLMQAQKAYLMAHPAGYSQ